MKSIDDLISELQGEEKIKLNELWVFQDDPRFPYLKKYHDSYFIKAIKKYPTMTAEELAAYLR